MNQRKIRKSAREIIDNAKADLLGEGWQEDYDNLDMECRAVYLGSVFNLAPSGKYYMPWACSNVEPCSRCKGSGCEYCGQLGSREAWEDQLFSEALQEYSEKYGLTVQAGEGDPCDLFLFEYRDRE